MGFKINFDNVMQSFSGPSPSDSYYDTKDRFQSILSSKLGYTNRAYHTEQMSNVVIDGIDFTDLTLKSGASASEIDAKLSGTEMAGLGGAFVDAEAKYGVNAWFLTGLAAHESAFGTSRIAQSKQNLFGFAAYDGSPYTSAKSFSSYEEGIDRVADYLSQNYLNQDGKYYNGLSIQSVNQKYATDENWSNAIMQQVMQMIDV